MKLKSLSIVLASVLSMSVLSANASGLTSTGNITSLNSGNAVLLKGTMTGNPDGCADTDAFVLGADNADYKNIYAGLLTAYAADKSVRLFLDGCIDNLAGTKNRAEIGSIVLQ